MPGVTCVFTCFGKIGVRVVDQLRLATDQFKFRRGFSQQIGIGQRIESPWHYIIQRRQNTQAATKLLAGFNVARWPVHTLFNMTYTFATSMK